MNDARRRIEWAKRNMHLLGVITDEFRTSAPFTGLRIGVSLHLEPKTAVLLLALEGGGADVLATGNLGTTQDDIADELGRQGITVVGHRETDIERHLVNVAEVAASHPDLLLDNGADLVSAVVHNGHTVRGGTEEATSGGFRLREEMGSLIGFPIIVINDSPLKAIVENRHAVGQSVMESFLRITNLMPQGRRFLVVGYGYCGSGIAHYLRSIGGEVMVAEEDEIKALEAAMDGFSVVELAEGAGTASVVITATGRPGVFSGASLAALRDGAILANAGHFDDEIDVVELANSAAGRMPLDDGIEAFEREEGGTVYLLNEGRMFNLGGRAPKGNSIEAMDLGFALQARSLERLATRADELEAGPQPVPDDINRELATAMVRKMRRDDLRPP